MRRKWKQSVDFDSMASDAELDEAYLDELEKQVRNGNLNLNKIDTQMYLRGYIWSI